MTEVAHGCHRECEADRVTGRADANGDCLLDTTDLGYLLSSYGTPASAGNYVGYAWDAENRLEADSTARGLRNPLYLAG